MDVSNELIAIIDDRINKILSSKKISMNYPAQVIGVPDSTKAIVKIAGYDTEFTFLNKCNQELAIGDSVYVQAIGGDLSNGVIAFKFG